MGVGTKMQSSKEIKLITRLNQFTSNNQIKWHILNPPKTITYGSNDYIPVYYETKYEGRLFAIYEVREQNYDGANDSFYWNEGIAFVMLDSENRVLWESRNAVSAVHDLFIKVRNQVSGIGNLFDELDDIW